MCTIGLDAWTPRSTAHLLDAQLLDRRVAALARSVLNCLFDIADSLVGKVDENDDRWHDNRLRIEVNKKPAHRWGISQSGWLSTFFASLLWASHRDPIKAAPRWTNSLLTVRHLPLVNERSHCQHRTRPPSTPPTKAPLIRCARRTSRSSAPDARGNSYSHRSVGSYPRSRTASCPSPGCCRRLSARRWEKSSRRHAPG